MFAGTEVRCGALLTMDAALGLSVPPARDRV